jgi:ribosomal protein S8
MLRRKYRKVIKFSYNYSIPSESIELKLDKSIDSYHSVKDKKFNFLNLSYEFKDKIDWNTLIYGKLWAYNLNYFEYLNQKDMDKDRGLILIYDYIDHINLSTEGLEPFPISLRGMNWIKFLTTHNIKEKKIDDSLYSQYKILVDNLEYHLLGNHLLENGFSLLFAAYYFNDNDFYEKAREILSVELDEQILEDGAHFELTPMYHQIMFFRVLDCLNLVVNNNIFNKELKSLLTQKASKMYTWLHNISYKDGNIPHFNDSTDNIAPISNELFNYAKRLKIIAEEIELSDSGYRSYSGSNYELKVDVGEIGPSYIPGHAHSDTFNFELRVDGKPCIVDSGISTYESNSRRLTERKTFSHNTVEINNIDQSQVWSSFRVANRANIIDIYEKDGYIKAIHNGYKNLDIKHQRIFKIATNNISIEDLLIAKSIRLNQCFSYIHFHPEVGKLELKDDKLILENMILSIEGSKKLQLDDFMFACGFNKLKNAQVLKITFEDKLFVNISFI